MSLFSKNNLSRSQVYVLLGARGNPDHGQDPEQPPFGVPSDQLFDCDAFWHSIDLSSSMAAVAKQVRAFIEEHDLGGGNWVGGDVWEDGKHLGHVAYNGRFFPGEQGPLVRHGEFVFDALLANPLAGTIPKTQHWKGALLAAIEASTEEDWYHLLTIRPDLGDRLREVLDRLAPESKTASPVDVPAMAREQVLLSALEAIQHQLSVGEASEGNRRDIAWCARTASAALDTVRTQSSIESKQECSPEP